MPSEPREYFFNNQYRLPVEQMLYQGQKEMTLAEAERAAAVSRAKQQYQYQYDLEKTRASAEVEKQKREFEARENAAQIEAIRRQNEEQMRQRGQQEYYAYQRRFLNEQFDKASKMNTARYQLNQDDIKQLGEQESTLMGPPTVEEKTRMIEQAAAMAGVDKAKLDAHFKGVDKKDWESRLPALANKYTGLNDQLSKLYSQRLYLNTEAAKGIRFKINDLMENQRRLENVNPDLLPKASAPSAPPPGGQGNGQASGLNLRALLEDRAKRQPAPPASQPAVSSQFNFNPTPAPQQWPGVVPAMGQFYGGLANRASTVGGALIGAPAASLYSAGNKFLFGGGAPVATPYQTMTPEQQAWWDKANGNMVHQVPYNATVNSRFGQYMDMENTDNVNQNILNLLQRQRSPYMPQ